MALTTLANVPPYGRYTTTCDPLPSASRVMVEPNPRWSAGFFGSVEHSPAASYARTIASVLIFRTSGVVTAEVTIGRCDGLP